MSVARIAGEVTAIVKTFERPRSLDRLIRSIKRYYPSMRVVVGDDSVTAYPRRDVDYVRLPVDIGVAAGRNALLEEVRTPFFLTLDDDFAFTPQTQIERLAETIERHNAALVAGDLMLCKHRFGLWVQRERQVYHGVIRREGDTLRLAPGYSGSVGDAFECDMTLQFFLGSTDVFREIGGWFAPLKMDDRQELFLRLKQHGFRVLHRPDVVAEHWPDRPDGYAAYRARDYLPLVASRHGLRCIQDMDGAERVFPDSCVA